MSVEKLIEVSVPAPDYPPLPPLPRYLALYALYEKRIGGMTWNIDGPKHSVDGVLEEVMIQGHQYEVIRSTIRVFRIPDPDVDAKR